MCFLSASTCFPNLCNPPYGIEFKAIRRDASLKFLEPALQGPAPFTPHPPPIHSFSESEFLSTYYLPTSLDFWK